MFVLCSCLSGRTPWEVVTRACLRRRAPPSDRRHHHQLPNNHHRLTRTQTHLLSLTLFPPITKGGPSAGGGGGARLAGHQGLERPRRADPPGAVQRERDGGCVGLCDWVYMLVCTLVCTGVIISGGPSCVLLYQSTLHTRDQHRTINTNEQPPQGRRAAGRWRPRCCRRRCGSRRRRVLA